MTEQQVYRLIEKRDGYELREYAPVAIASVGITGDIQNAPNQGFRKLFRYISTHQIAMTAPVVQTEQGTNQWLVEFIMPAGSTAADLPSGTDIGVEVRQQPTELLAVASFRGGIGGEKILAKSKELRAELDRVGLSVTGPLQIARFNSPFVPVPLRYNEIRFPVNQRVDTL